VKRVLLDCDSVNFIDVSAGDELLGLIKALQKTGIAVAFVRVRDSVRDDMRRAEIELAVGRANFFERTTDGVRAWQKQSSSAA
jgi:MFS superfamily sulfate permease-like transporter